jgi:hypothetical protein
MQSAQQITFLSHTAVNDDGIQGTNAILTVNFQVYRKGPAHMAGIIFTTDGWATASTAMAQFQSFGPGDVENWKASVTVGGNNVRFQYVIFCDDFAGLNQVPRIYDTNGGNQYSITSSFA